MSASLEVGERVPRAFLIDICDALGHDADTVASIAIEADEVRVEVWSRTDPWGTPPTTHIHFVEG